MIAAFAEGFRQGQSQYSGLRVGQSMAVERRSSEDSTTDQVQPSTVFPLESNTQYAELAVRLNYRTANPQLPLDGTQGQPDTVSPTQQQ